MKKILAGLLFVVGCFSIIMPSIGAVKAHAYADQETVEEYNQKAESQENRKVSSLSKTMLNAQAATYTDKRNKIRSVRIESLRRQKQGQSCNRGYELVLLNYATKKERLTALFLLNFRFIGSNAVRK